MSASEPAPLRPFGHDLDRPGDFETAADFDRAHHYLAMITAHWTELGLWWEKQPQDVVDELDYHNAWHQYEVEQERKAGEQQAEYRAVSLQQLQTLSKQRLLTVEATSRAMTVVDQVVQHVDALIEQAVLEQAQLEHLMATACPAPTALTESLTTTVEDVPF